MTVPTTLIVPVPTIPAKALRAAAPEGRTPTLLQTTAPENPRAAVLALASWLEKLGLSEGDAAHVAGTLLAHFDLVPSGLGPIIRDAAREMHAHPKGSEGSASLASLGPAVLLAIHEAYGPELARPSAIELAERRAAVANTGTR